LDRSSAPDAGSDNEHLAAVSIPAVIGVIGPDVLASTRVTIVELGQRTLWVEGPSALVTGDVVALACVLPDATPMGGAPAPVLAVAVASGSPRPGPESSWRSPLVIQQIDGADGERLAAVGTRADFRRGGRR
jgi:hypothetical protein